MKSEDNPSVLLRISIRNFDWIGCVLPECWRRPEVGLIQGLNIEVEVYSPFPTVIQDQLRVEGERPRCKVSNTQCCDCGRHEVGIRPFPTHLLFGEPKEGEVQDRETTEEARCTVSSKQRRRSSTANLIGSIAAWRCNALCCTIQLVFAGRRVWGEAMLDHSMTSTKSLYESCVLGIIWLPSDP